jgi:hypothetical protein
MMIKRLVRKLRNEGPRGAVTAIKARLSGDAKYQEKLGASFEHRWSMLRSAIPGDCGSLLDIGSNLGAFTARAAREGLISLGIEKDAELVRRSVRMHDARCCAFMRADLNLAICAKLPPHDAILLLSVHHHWHHNFGASEAAEMLRAIVAKANRVVIFEGPSRSSRYESNIPAFADNVETEVVAYYEDYLARTVGPLASRITRLGKAACVGEREPFRWMYAIER